MARNQLNLITGEFYEEPNIMTSRAGNTYATFAVSVEQPHVGEYGTSSLTDTIEFLCFGAHAERLEGAEPGDLISVQFNVNIDENEGRDGQVFRNVKLMVNDLLLWGELRPSGAVAAMSQAARFGVVAGVVSSDEIIRIDKDGNHHLNLRLTVVEEIRRRRRDGDPFEPGDDPDWFTEWREAEWPFRGVPEILGPRSAAANLKSGDLVMVHYVVTGDTWETRDGVERISNHLYANEIVPFPTDDAPVAPERPAPAAAAEPPRSNVADLEWE